MNNALPTAFLPRLISKQILISSLTLLVILNKLQSLYSNKFSSKKVKRNAQDSGYSSEVEEDDEDLIAETSGDLGKDDTYERTFTKEWLLKIIRRGEEWIEEVSSEEDYELLEEERNRRILVIELASSLVASLSETSESGSISRPLSLPTSILPLSTPLNIILHDALPSDTDPSSVGVQSWGASIILAKMMALDPQRFGMNDGGAEGEGSRMLELGAGTGLLSLVWRGMLEKLSESTTLSNGESSASNSNSQTIVATDYHPTVLSNLSHNISLNNHSNSLPIQVEKLDWSAIHKSLKFTDTATQNSLILPTPFNEPFNTLLAADVIYGQEHAKWLKSCAICFLKKPTSTSTNPLSLEKLSLDTPSTTSTPTFHLIVPLRPTHTAAIATITEVFPLSSSLPPRENEDDTSWRMAIKSIEEIERVKGIGRADEGGYRLYKIGWC